MSKKALDTENLRDIRKPDCRSSLKIGESAELPRHWWGQTVLDSAYFSLFAHSVFSSLLDSCGLANKLEVGLNMCLFRHS